jgi:hypothetical protein
MEKSLSSEQSVSRTTYGHCSCTKGCKTKRCPCLAKDRKCHPLYCKCILGIKHSYRVMFCNLSWWMINSLCDDLWWMIASLCEYAKWFHIMRLMITLPTSCVECANCSNTDVEAQDTYILQNGALEDSLRDLPEIDSISTTDCFGIDIYALLSYYVPHLHRHYSS